MCFGYIPGDGIVESSTPPSVERLISTQGRGLINSGRTRWRLTIWMGAVVVESERNPASKHQIQPERGE